jgi:acid phosphatase
MARKIKFLLLLGPLTQMGCAAHNENLNSVLWYQTSSERYAISIQTYEAAKLQLKAAKSDAECTEKGDTECTEKGDTECTEKGDTECTEKGDTECAEIEEQKSGPKQLPPAVILDIDETVLDNSVYQGMLVKKNAEHPAFWDQWVKKHEATAIPGAVSFIEAASEKNIKVFYVTNRECKDRKDGSGECPQKYDTLENLKKIGITTSAKPENIFLVKDKVKDHNWKKGHKCEKETEWNSDKECRRLYIAEKYQVLIIIGDDLGDFLPCVKKRNKSSCNSNGSNVNDRLTLTGNQNEKWGKQWFMLPNPMYGSWIRVLPTPHIKNIKSFNN